MRLLPIPLTSGRADKIEPRFAPAGVLKTCQNLRLRKDGRLVSRTGYQPLTMTQSGTTYRAYDLHNFNDRLVVLANAASSDIGYPEKLIEYSEIASPAWIDNNQMIAPFGAIRKLNLGQLPGQTVVYTDSASGGGYTAVTVGSNSLIVINESTNQILYSVLITGGLNSVNKIVFSVDTFYILQNTSLALSLLSFKVGTDTSVNQLVANVSTSATAITAADICPIGNPTTGRVAIAWDRGSGTASTIRVYNSAGVAIGSDITYGTIADVSISLSMCADQTANRISVVNAIGGTGYLNIFNFSGTVIFGPQGAVSSDRTVGICRLVNPSALGATYLVVTGDSAGLFQASIWAEDGSGSGPDSGTNFIRNFAPTTRPIPWNNSISGEFWPNSFVIGGVVSPDITATLATPTVRTSASNALFLMECSANPNNIMCVQDPLVGIIGSGRNNNISYDSSNGRVSWSSLFDTGGGMVMARVVSFDKHSAVRRQAARYGNLAYFAGSPLHIYDGINSFVGFQEPPGIISATPSAAAGSLVSGATYSYVLHWEVTFSDGSYLPSAPSAPFNVTLGASDNRVTVVGTVPHHRQRFFSNDVYIQAVLSRTTWDAGTGIPSSEFRRNQLKSGFVLVSVGGTVSFTDDLSDANLADEEVIYTQGARGALSACLPHDAGRPCQFITATETRIDTTGLLVDNEFQVSKEAFLGEAIEFSDFSSFRGQVSGRTRGIHSLDGVRYLFTANDVFGFTGESVDDLGGGTVGTPQRLPSSSGLESWTSLLEAPEGLYFQLDDNKLYLIPRGGGTPEWVGIDVQDTLVTYPKIMGACKSRRDDIVAFACQNAGGTDGRIITRSMRTGMWMEDTPPLQATSGLRALVNYGDTMAYISGTVVYVQSATSFADVSSTVIVTTLETNPIYPFGLGGNGTVHDVMLIGEYRSAGTGTLQISYDDGVSYNNYTSFVLSGLSVGQTVKKRWVINQTDLQSLKFKLTYTPSSAGEGFVAFQLTLLVNDEPGALPELAAADCGAAA